MSPRIAPKLLAGLVALLAAVLVLSGTASAATIESRTSGAPQSPNGASSMHLWWQQVAPTTRVAVDLDVVETGAGSDLHYWALQVAFVDADGATVGGAHLGLQRHERAPLGAVNWGGYRTSDGTVLEPRSTLDPVDGAPGTFHHTWQPGEQHELVIEGTGDGWWTASIQKVGSAERTVVGRLHGGGARLARPVVWSEVFAPCQSRATARWSGFEPAVRSVQATYQSHADGGCTNTDAALDTISGGVVQRTGATRATQHGALLTPLP